MQINKELTFVRLELAHIAAKTTLESLTFQGMILNQCLSSSVAYPLVKRCLDLAMQGNLFPGWLSELEMMIERDDKLRGHDYLKMFCKYFFILHFKASNTIVDTATHNLLQNVLTHEQKRTLLQMMRGYKQDLQGA